MHTPYDFCPKCQGLRRTSRYLGLQTVIGPQGKVDTLFYCYFCESCNTFIQRTSMLQEGLSRPPVPAESLH